MKKTALITGASSGIGKEIAQIHAKSGGDLIIVARRSDRLQELKQTLEKQHSIKVYTLSLDLTQPGLTESIDSFLSENNLRVDYFINNAGFGGSGPFKDQTWKDNQKMIQLNIMAATELLHYFVAKMLEQGSGKILNVASTAGLIPAGPNLAVYCATKAYFVSLSKALYQELKNTPISVTALCPGATETEFAKVANSENAGIFKKSASAQIVANDGYQAMLKGDMIVVSGLTTYQKTMMKLMPILPEKMLLQEIENMQKT